MNKLVNYNGLWYYLSISMIKIVDKNITIRYVIVFQSYFYSHNFINCLTGSTVRLVTLRNLGKAFLMMIVPFGEFESAFVDNKSARLFLTGLNWPFSQATNGIFLSCVLIPLKSLTSVFLATVHSTWTMTVLFDSNSVLNLPKNSFIRFFLKSVFAD